MSTTQLSSPVVEIAGKPVAATRLSVIQRPKLQVILVAAFLAIAILRIVSTYRLFNHTIDEASHIAGGIEWWDKGTYTLETKHTPVGRISVALGPYLAGVRWIGATRWEDTYPILSENGNYWLNLTLGRVGVLPYFIIATLVVFFWTRRLFGVPTALLAVAIFTQLPTILTHSSVATTDMPLTAMFCWSLYLFTLWLREPNFKTAAWFGAITGLAFATKLSAVVYLPASAVLILVMYSRIAQPKWRALLRTLAIVAVCAFLAIWAVYRFSHAPLAQVTKLPERAAAKAFHQSSAITAAVHAVTLHIPVPAPEFFDGIRMLKDQNHQGSRAFLFGRVKQGGWWYFFFVALALKTPIAVLLLAVFGSALVLKVYWHDRENWQVAAPLAAFAMIMLASTPARLDSGVRYVLPVFVLLAIVAALALKTLWESNRQRVVSRAAAVVLLGWLSVSSALAHPDYLAYFNEFGGHDPSRLIVVGDYDWGQDLTRLSEYLRQHSVQHLSMAYDGFFEPAPLGLPPTDPVGCDGRPTGWVAMETRRVRLHPECYLWMHDQHPIAQVGKTMSVYYVR